MKAKLAFVAGLGAGYVVGTRVGRRGYENLKKTASTLWQTDKVQRTVKHLEDSVTEEVKDLGSHLLHKPAGNAMGAKDDAGQAGHDAAGQGASRQGAAAKAAAANGTAAKPNDDDALPDLESDPALNDSEGQDWSDEGGALRSGPSH